MMRKDPDANMPPSMEEEAADAAEAALAKRADALEQLLDHWGPRELMYQLMAIAQAKAEHVQTNWQDKALAESWEETAQAFSDADNQLTKIWGPA